MSLCNVTVKQEYRSLIDDVAKDFYMPLLTEAISYKRAVGFFSSSVLVDISKGIASLAENGGTIQLIASPYLSDEDIVAIRQGYEMRGEIIENALIRGLHEAKNDGEKSRLNLLANLIADEILDIKIALTEQNGQIGMYHEKMGIIADNEGNKVAFSGSMNESHTAMSVNYEAIDVFCSWNDLEGRVANKENAFTSIWNNREPSIETIFAPKLTDEIIRRYKTAKPDFDIDKNELAEAVVTPMKKHIVAIPGYIKLHDYQVGAIDEWQNQGYCGIFDMATGTGKTYTGLGAVVRLLEYLEGRLALFIVCPYQHLVEQWVEDIEIFGINPIIGYSASPQKDWKKRLEDAILDQKLKVRSKEFFCFVSTNATFASKYVQNQIYKIKNDALLIIDEAHNFGANHLSQMLSDRFKYRLALSATINRHNDEEGTAKLFNYFGVKCIEYTLEKAIEEKKLTKYKYYPIITTLSEAELNKYTELTHEIGKCIIKDKNGKIKLSEKGKHLAIARAKIVAGAEDKIAKLEEYIAPYVLERHILIYCGVAKTMAENQDFSDVDDYDLRQIDVVTDLLGNKLNMKVSQFTSKEDAKERAILKREFTDGDNLQALIAIKCLDEGVNIPKIKLAFILASTTNPKEYIQRRGRVLRLAEGKEFAVIFDFVTIPRSLDEVPSLTEAQMAKDMSLIKNELSRVIEFTRIAMNQIEGQSVIDKIKEAYCIKESDYFFGKEINYE